MANRMEYDTKLSPEGRVVIPAEVRRILGAEVGGQILFIVEGQQVQLATPRLLAEQVWANNQGGEGGDSAADVRVLRDEDRRATEARWERMEMAGRSDARTDEDVLSNLRSGLGLDS